MIKKIQKLSLALSVIALAFAVAVPTTYAALTFGALTASSDGALTLTAAVGSAVSLGTNATTGTITVGGTSQTGTITLGSSDSANTLAIAAGTGATTVNIANTQTAGAVNIGAGMTTGTITIGGTGLQTGTIGIGTGTGAQTINLGTGGTGIKTINLGTGAVANVITVGSVTGAASLDLLFGTGDFTIDGAVDGTITIGDTAQTGTITIGDSSGTLAIDIGTGEGATTLGLATGGTAANTINIGTGAIGNIITIGSATAAASLSLLGGTGDISIVSIDDLTLNGGSAGSIINVGTNVDGNVINVGTDNTAADTINIGSALDTIGVTGAVTVTGNVSLTNGALTYADTNAEGACAAGAVTIDLSLGNFHTTDMSGAADCTITFSNGAAGELHLIQLEYSGTNNFILADVTQQSEVIEDVCASATAGEPDADGDKVTLLVRATAADVVMIVSCAANILA